MAIGIQQNLRNTLLIAMPQMSDPNFSGSVIYICEHNEDGAMGLVINRPLSISVDDLFQHINIPYSETADRSIKHVFLGGPVEIEHGFILHTYNQNELDERTSIAITDDIALTSSHNILLSIGAGTGPHLALISLGYTGWGAGQLEQELADNVWLNASADKAILFTTPFEQRLEQAAAGIGVDLTLLSHEAGHA